MNLRASFSPRLLRVLAVVASACLLSPPGLRAQEPAGSNHDSFERAVLAEVNFARTEPARYAEFLAGCRAHYQGNLLALPGEPPTRTREGVAALDEAVQTLRRARPLPPLALSDGLGRAAAELARDQARTGAHGHRAADGSTPFARMSRHGRWHSHAGEAIDYGGLTARRVVFNLIVDDGVRDRGHRLNLLAPDFRVAGIARASHPRYRQMCVIDFAADYTEAGAPSVLGVATADATPHHRPGVSGRGFRRVSVGMVPSALGGWRN